MKLIEWVIVVNFAIVLGAIINGSFGLAVGFLALTLWSVHCFKESDKRK